MAQPPDPATDGRAEPPGPGHALLAALERPFLVVDRLLRRILPDNLNPLMQPGAVANTLMLVATASGILVLFWYVPSVHQAHSSLELARASFIGQLMRSLHRYSSDGCVLFVALHALRSLAERKFAGPRWLAWVTGLVATWIIWLVGWLGYWLVWDERARQVALGTAVLVDELPIFVDPLSRAFLTDSSLNTFLFFVVFFIHMLLPLVMAVALWLHITRLSRPRYLTNLSMTGWIMGSLVVVSLVHPAWSVAPARMLHTPGSFTMDGWYLLPLALTDRLGGGALWAISLLTGMVLCCIPWTLARKAPVPSVVDVPKCNSCQKCFTDCPYDAISMVPRTDGRNFLQQAQVNPERCVGCGICAGSCDSSGVGLPWLPALGVRDLLEPRLDVSPGATVVFGCALSAASSLRVDVATGQVRGLTNTLLVSVPCAGWVHPLTIERALKHGAARVVVLACPTGTCNYREGSLWADQRMEGTREPALRTEKVDAARVTVVHLDRTEGKRADAMLRGLPVGPPAPARPHRVVLGGLGLAAVLGVTVVAGSEVPYAPPVPAQADLTVSFKHPGVAGEHCRKISEEEKSKLPPHMRRDEICERGRSPVRLRVLVDGQVVHQAAYDARGLFGDGVSIVVAHIPVSTGEHAVHVDIGDSHDGTQWAFQEDHTLRWQGTERHVALFERTSGFTWE